MNKNTYTIEQEKHGLFSVVGTYKGERTRFLPFRTQSEAEEFKRKVA